VSDAGKARNLSDVPLGDQERFLEERRLRDEAFEAEDRYLSWLAIRIRIEEPGVAIAQVRGVPVRADVAEMFRDNPTPPSVKRRRRVRPP